MIYILDNNEAYSDHGIYFYENDVDHDDMIILCEIAGYLLLGSAEKVDWWEGGTIEGTLPIDLYDFFTYAYSTDSKAKYQDINGYHRFNPKSKAFDLLLSCKEAKKLALRFLDGNTTTARTAAFKQELAERGLVLD